LIVIEKISFLRHFETVWDNVKSSVAHMADYGREKVPEAARKIVLAKEKKAAILERSGFRKDSITRG